MTKLRLAQNLALPLEAVTETFAILAKRGVGKTYTASVLAEEMVGVGAQVVILDPLDAWWGLRSSADGNGEGLSLYVFGGEHQDLPLEATSGELLADVVVDHGVSVILSLRHLSKTKQRTFVADFAERLYHRKGEPEHRTPLHVFVDEADAFVPQRVLGETARMVGAIDDLVRRGRSSGIGVTLISQRAAVVNKDVLTQAEVLIALRTISPQDRKALDAWVEAHDAHDQRVPFMESLASLAVGEAWLWSPGWLDIFQRVHIRQRRTFDSSATPKAGARPAQPKERAAVDLEQLGERIAATIEKAKADDPKELRRRIVALERELQQRPTKAVTETVVERVEVPVLNGEVDRLEAAVSKLNTVAMGLGEIGKDIGGIALEVVSAIGRVKGVSAAPARSARPAAVAERPRPTPRPAAAPRITPEGDVKLGKAERSVLSVLAQYPQGRSKKQVALATGYAINGGGFNNAIGALRSAGYVEGSKELLAATEAGMDAIADQVEPLPTGTDLLDHWLAHPRLGKAERLILEHLHGIYPATATKEEVAEATGYAAEGGGFNNAIGRLRTLELIAGDRSALVASEELF